VVGRAVCALGYVAMKITDKNFAIITFAMRRHAQEIIEHLCVKNPKAARYKLELLQQQVNMAIRELDDEEHES